MSNIHEHQQPMKHKPTEHTQASTQDEHTAVPNEHKAIPNQHKPMPNQHKPIPSERKPIQDEFAFIQELTQAFQPHQQGTLLPNGDDAAIYKPSLAGQVVCLDTMIEGIHFKRETMSPAAIGYKCLASNLSDIAAVGGIPSYFLVSLCVSPHWSKEEMIDLYLGMKQLADEWGIDLLGGDTVSTPHDLMISVTAIGQVEEGVLLSRSNAKPSQLLFLTGQIGDSAGGLDILLHRSELRHKATYSSLVQAHQRPTPHIRQGRILAHYAPSTSIALNDISDGLASESNEIASSSNVSLVIHKEHIPLSAALVHYAQETNQDPYHWALYGGEDYVLLGTAAPEQCTAIKHMFKQEGLFFQIIGHVEDGEGQVYLEHQGKRELLGKRGFNHFQ